MNCYTTRCRIDDIKERLSTEVRPFKEDVPGARTSDRRDQAQGKQSSRHAQDHEPRRSARSSTKPGRDQGAAKNTDGIPADRQEAEQVDKQQMDRRVDTCGVLVYERTFDQAL